MCISVYIYISTYNYLYIYPFPIFYLFPNLSRTFNTILEPRYLPSTNSPSCRALHRPGPPNRGGRRGRRGPQGLRGPRPRAEERPRRSWRGKSRCGVKLEQEPNGWRYENQMWILLEIVLFDCHSVIQDSQNEKKGLWMTKQLKKKLEEEW